jgi:hypothetical protein
MAANHDDLILEGRVGARDLGDRVEAVLMLASELGFYIDLDRVGT